MIYTVAGATKRVALSNGDGTFTVMPTVTISDVVAFSAGHWDYGDFNGDGKTDIIYTPSGTSNSKRIMFSTLMKGTSAKCDGAGTLRA